MQIDLIETFLDLMETRSFNRTAERLDVTQSTVSHRVNALEAAFNRKLFVRGKGGTVPTVAGLRLLDHAKALQSQWHEAVRSVEAAGTYERSMRIGIQHDVAEMIGGRFLKAIREEMPGTSTYLEADYSIQMNRDLGAGDLDLAVLYTPHHLPDLHYERIGEIAYVLVSTSAVSLAEIRPQDYIYANYSPAFDRAHRMALPQFAASAVAAGRNLILGDLVATLGGATYVTQKTAETLVSEKSVRRVADAPVIPQIIHAATNIRSRHSHQHRKLIAILCDLLSEP
ncbi:LysR family transcriptional regulator [Neorhizobium lilium]|uniref:LysR family transcriptional regulator n=1 Tax=Neorhizobium lilium TaxID=2503024 RepID=A0A3S3SJ46_9HYPH|nr:LysR family transcriptional regulator [Neorhizobium lilium]RWX81737.1 LysR family transcriptional regulator [Neorhizobium lilium]